MIPTYPSVRRFFWSPQSPNSWGFGLVFANSLHHPEGFLKRWLQLDTFADVSNPQVWPILRSYKKTAHRYGPKICVISLLHHDFDIRGMAYVYLYCIYIIILLNHIWKRMPWGLGMPSANSNIHTWFVLYILSTRARSTRCKEAGRVQEPLSPRTTVKLETFSDFPCRQSEYSAGSLWYFKWPSFFVPSLEITLDHHFQDQGLFSSLLGEVP